MVKAGDKVTETEEPSSRVSGQVRFLPRLGILTVLY
jgi:hypothetical protein